MYLISYKKTAFGSWNNCSISGNANTLNDIAIDSNISFFI